MLSSGSAVVFRGVAGELTPIVEWDKNSGVLYVVGKMVVSNSLRGPSLQG